MKKVRDPNEPFAFARLYAFVSLVAVLFTAAALAVLYRELSIRNIIEFGERSNVTVATTALNAILPELAEYLRTEAPITAVGTDDTVATGLLGLIRASVRDTPVERIKIYNREGIVLYSTLKHEIGTDSSANYRFQRSIQGEVRSELRYRDPFNPFDHGADHDNLIETYVPIRQHGSPEPVGVFELYTDVNPIIRAMAHNELLIFTGIVVIMVILYGSLLYVVRRSERIISSQSQTILRRNQTLEVLSARMLAAEETERRRIAWELHEEIAQTLSAIKIKVEASANTAARSVSLSGAISSEEIVPLLQEAIRDVRALAMDLRPSALDDFGLVATTRWLCREAEEVHGQLGITQDIAVREEDVPDPLKSVIFRVVQQTLKRLVRIPGISDISVALRREQGLQLIVDFGAEADEADNGAEPPSASEEQRIADLWERAVLSGGSLRTTHIDKGRSRYQATWLT